MSAARRIVRVGDPNRLIRVRSPGDDRLGKVPLPDRAGGDPSGTACLSPSPGSKGGREMARAGGAGVGRLGRPLAEACRERSRGDPWGAIPPSVVSCQAGAAWTGSASDPALALRGCSVRIVQRPAPDPAPCSIGSQASGDDIVPRISEFYGILIYMYYGEHGAPHFHAIYGEHDAVISIRGLRVLDGWLPARALRLVRLWARQRREDLEMNWALAREGRRLRPVPPLE